MIPRRKRVVPRSGSLVVKKLLARQPYRPVVKFEGGVGIEIGSTVNKDIRQIVRDPQKATAVHV